MLAMVLTIIISSLLLTACNDEPDSDGPDIVGTWMCRNIDVDVSYTICFKSNGTRWMEWSGSDEDYHWTFQYSAKNERIFFNDEYDYWVCEYTIKGGRLTIYGNPWGEDDDINVISLIRI